MAASEAEIQDQMKKVIHVWETQREQAEDDADSLVSLIDTAEQALEGNSVAQVAAGLRGFRRAIANAMSGQALAAPLSGVLSEYGKFMDIPETSPRAILARLYIRFHDNSLRVQSRVFSRGAPAAASAINGDGAIHRLTTDQYGYALQHGFAELKTAECVVDQNSGTERHEELFEFRGADAGDAMEELGSGRVLRVPCVSARSSIISNPSFSNFSGSTGTPTAITSWTFDAGTVGTCDIDETNYYRDFPGDVTPRSLDTGAQSITISQKLSVRGTRLQRNTPYYIQIAYNRSVNSATGTLTLHLGSRSTSVVLAAQSGWNILTHTVNSNNCWYRNFQEDELDVKVEWAHTGGTGLLLDDIIFAPMVRFDGTYYMPVGGATPFLADPTEKFTWTDTISSEGIVQRWLIRAFSAYLPHAADSTVTLADP